MNKKTMSLAVVIIILTVFVGLFCYFAKNKKEIVPEKNKEQGRQETANQAKEIADEEDRSGVESEGSYESAGDGMYWFIVKEMGIKFKVRKELKDDGLLYYYEKNVETPAIGKLAESVKFSTKELEKLDEICSTKELPLGVFVKLSGKIDDYKNNEYIAGREPKQIKDFIVYYNGPDAPCTNKENAFFSKKNMEQRRLFIINAIDSLEAA